MSTRLTSTNTSLYWTAYQARPATPDELTDWTVPLYVPELERSGFPSETEAIAFISAEGDQEGWEVGFFVREESPYVDKDPRERRWSVFVLEPATPEQRLRLQDGKRPAYVWERTSPPRSERKRAEADVRLALKGSCLRAYAVGSERLTRSDYTRLVLEFRARGSQ